MVSQAGEPILFCEILDAVDDVRIRNLFDFSQSINRLISLAVTLSMSFPPALDLSVGFPPDTYSIQQALYVVKPFVDIF